MRHRDTTNSLSRDVDHRRALLRNMMTSLFEHGRIQVTEAKAKAVIPHVERLIYMTKKHDAMNAIRLANANLFTENASRALITYAQSAGKRESGFCRLTKLRVRQDSSTIVQLELIEQAADAAANTDAKPAKAKKASAASAE